MPDRQVKETQVRWMIRRDVARVLQIDAEGYPEPWTEENLVSHLRVRNCIGMVACPGGVGDITSKIQGFMVYELYSARLRILRLAVDPLFRFQGVGAAMIDRLKNKLAQQHRTMLEILVDERSTAAHIFLRKHGFKAVRVDRYETGDDYLFRFTLPKE